MIQALNYSTKAMECLNARKRSVPALMSRAFDFLIDKLVEAQTFVLPDHGDLLERGKPRPQVPGTVFRPPFPVIALEFSAIAESGRPVDQYTAVRSSKRIALVWDVALGLPFPEIMPDVQLDGGVVICPISYFDDEDVWMPTVVAGHMSYEDAWQPYSSEGSPFLQSLEAAGHVPKAITKGSGYPFTMVPMLPEPLAEIKRAHGVAAMFDFAGADLTDEIAVYMDLCIALSCNNVSADRRPASHKLNRSRLKSGRLPLKDFHVLQINGAGLGGLGLDGASRSRSHLRRGHIRRLGPERITWVNACMVRGSRPGFVDKHYAPKEIAL